MTKYSVRECFTTDYPLVAEFFNRNRAYQVDDHKLTAKDVALSFQLKEMQHFYLLFKGDQLVGTSGQFHFIFEGISFPGGIFSGFLLIDPTVRDGEAIRSLHRVLQDKAIIKNPKTCYCEVNIANKAALQLSRMNGYVIFEDTWEDPDHYILLRSDLPKVKGTFKFSGDLLHDFDLKKLTFLHAEWKNRSYMATFSMEERKIEVGITNRHPWFIKLPEFELKIENGTLYYSGQDHFQATKMIVRNNQQQQTLSLPRKHYALPLHSPEEQTDVIFIKGEKALTVHLTGKEEKLKRRKQEQKVAVENLFITHGKINQETGDITYFYNEDQVFVDFFPKYDSTQKPVITIHHSERKCIIKATYPEGIITKTVCWQNRSIDHKLEIALNKEKLLKYGLQLSHHDYFVETKKDHFERFKWENTPRECVDFARADLFDQSIKRYFLPRFKMEMSVSSSQKSANQMGYRPLFVKNVKSQETAVYRICFNPSTLKNRLKNPKVNHHQILKRMPCHLQNIRIRSEQNNLPIMPYEGIAKANKVNYTVESACNKEKIMVPRAPGNYTGIFFEFKMQRDVFIRGDGYQMLLCGNGAWVENDQTAAFVDESKGTGIRLYVEGSQLFTYKKRNTIYMRIISKNTNKSSQFVTINLMEVE